MPLQRIDEVAPGVKLGLWRITEQAEELPRPTTADVSAYHGGRLKEKLVTYALLHAMTGNNDGIIGHDSSGKPLLANMHISLSHTKGWAALILSPYQEVAVDIEYRSNRVCRVADRFMRDDEAKGGVDIQLTCWSAKETTFKFFSADHLLFQDMRMAPFTPSDHGVLTMENLRRKIHLTVHYELNADYVLTWATSL